MRPPREAYARGVYQYANIEIIGGVEYRNDEAFAPVRDELRLQLQQAPCYSPNLREETIAAEVESRLAARWPDRAYFIEVGNDKEGWIQIFQPFGLPRNSNTVSLEDID